MKPKYIDMRKILRLLIVLFMINGKESTGILSNDEQIEFQFVQHGK